MFRFPIVASRIKRSNNGVDQQTHESVFACPSYTFMLLLTLHFILLASFLV